MLQRPEIELGLGLWLCISDRRERKRGGGREGVSE